MVRAGDQDALVRVLDRLLGDPALQERIGMAGRCKIQERFSADVVVPRLEKLYAEFQVAPTSVGPRTCAAHAAQV
jgi:glycosyltransferase involved in cell wall biosynthesis